MNHVLEVIGGDKVSINDEERSAIERALLDPSGPRAVSLSRLGRVIVLNSVKQIYREEDQDRSQQKLGVLHDGSPVVRQFGVWYDANSPRDERGNYTVTLDPTYYPEAARDCVPTPEEYEREYKNLPRGEDRLAKILGSGSERRIAGATDGFERIGRGKPEA